MPFGEDEAWNSHDDDVFTVVGTVLTDKAVKFNFLKETMATVWRPVKGMTAKELASNLFIFHFFHEKDTRKVMEEGPWSFEQHLIILHHLQENESPFDVDLSRADFWVQIHKIPKRMINLKMAEFIASQVGDYIKADLSNYERNLDGVHTA